MHQRTAIRNAVVARLIAASTAAGARVFPNRKAAGWEDEELPMLAVYTTSETSEYFDTDKLKRKLEVHIGAFVEEPADGPSADDALDSLLDQVENAILLDDYFGGLVDECILTGSDVDVLEGGKKTVAVAELTFETIYYTARVPPAPAGDFSTANFQIDTAPKDGVVDIEGNIDLTEA